MNRDTRSDFWSRRRAAVEAEAKEETQEAEAGARAAEEAWLEDRPDAEVLAELDLPTPEEMDSPDQVQSLLKAAVPQRLKTRALRRLWRLNPVLANVDGLVDYGEDFTDAAMVIENMQTIYQVGKGMFDKAIYEAESAEALAKAEADRAEADAAEAEAKDTVLRDDDDTAATEALADAAEVPLPAETPDSAQRPLYEPEIAEAPAASARRMRFRFETAT